MVPPAAVQLTKQVYSADNAKAALALLIMLAVGGDSNDNCH